MKINVLHKKRMNIELIESVETLKTGVANMKIMLIIS